MIRNASARWEAFAAPPSFCSTVSQCSYADFEIGVPATYATAAPLPPVPATVARADEAAAAAAGEAGTAETVTVDVEEPPPPQPASSSAAAAAPRQVRTVDPCMMLRSPFLTGV